MSWQPKKQLRLSFKNNFAEVKTRGQEPSISRKVVVSIQYAQTMTKINMISTSSKTLIQYESENKTFGNYP